MKRNPELDHTKKMPNGECAACAFLKRAIMLQSNPEWRKIYEDALDKATAEHGPQLVQAGLFGTVKS